ncbi:hypothetical protein ACFPH6_08635 [Streptomyces xiangluensis]|uniref:Uncharacterized protein n=1 Tax=Streptomyces xiangluensis TaxID=2665720 RepID=A0ABV8YKH0_9ACTN
MTTQPPVWIIGGYQSDFARNFTKESLDISDLDESPCRMFRHTERTARATSSAVIVRSIDPLSAVDQTEVSGASWMRPTRSAQRRRAACRKTRRVRRDAHLAYGTVPG